MTPGSAAVPPPAARSTGPVLPAAERGATVIPEKVIARIAVRAAQEALGALTDTSSTSDTSRALAGLAAPRASVTVGSGAARLALTLGLPYPADLAGASRHVQHHVSERVAHLTGMRVTEVTLAIEQLALAGGSQRRRVQ